MLTPQDVTTRFPAFAEVPVALVQVVLDEVYLAHLDEDAWGAAADIAAGYAAAHVLRVNYQADQDPTGQLGPVTAAGPTVSKRVGKLQATYQPGPDPQTQDEAWWNQSGYGRTFLNLKRKTFLGVDVTRP
jgi:hypothetical protein